MGYIIGLLIGGDKPFLSVKDYMLLEGSKHRIAIELLNLMDSNLARSAFSWKDIVYKGFSRYFLQAYNVCKHEEVTLFGLPQEIHCLIGSFLHPSDLQRKTTTIAILQYKEDSVTQHTAITARKRI